MRSMIKMFDMYKVGEYIPDINQEKMKYLKIIDKIPDENLKLEILRQDDYYHRHYDALFGIMLLLLLGLGALIGWALTYVIIII